VTGRRLVWTARLTCGWAGLAALVRVLAALVAALFLSPVYDLEQRPRDGLPGALGDASPPRWLLIVLPVAGACLVIGGAAAPPRRRPAPAA
jgi:hypothetical protein